MTISLSLADEAGGAQECCGWEKKVKQQPHRPSQSESKKRGNLFRIAAMTMTAAGLLMIVNAIIGQNQPAAAASMERSRRREGE